jgi:hypothetical protein
LGTDGIWLVVEAKEISNTVPDVTAIGTLVADTSDTRGGAIETPETAGTLIVDTPRIIGELCTVAGCDD